MVQSGRRPRLSCRVQKECGLALLPACSAGGKFAGEKLPVDVEQRLPYSESIKRRLESYQHINGRTIRVLSCVHFCNKDELYNAFSLPRNTKCTRAVNTNLEYLLFLSLAFCAKHSVSFNASGPVYVAPALVIQIKPPNILEIAIIHLSSLVLLRRRIKDEPFASV